MQFITTGNRIAIENFTIGDLYTITFESGTYINCACIGIGANFVSFQRNLPELLFTLTMETAELVSSIDLYAGGTGTTNYNELTNKPQIGGVELVGNKSLSDLGIQAEITEERPLSSAFVSGLGSAAAAESSDFATAAQGALAASAIQSAGSGLSKDGTTLNHSNSVTAKTSEGFAAITYDAQGHITGSTAATTAQLAALNSGITSTDVDQIGINENNISLIEQLNGAKNYLKIQQNITVDGSGITAVKNSDNSITLNGTATTTCYVNICTSSGVRLTLPAGTYVMYCPQANTDDVQMYDNSTWNAKSNNSKTFDGNTATSVIIRISSGQSFSNTIVYPMIVTKSTFDSGLLDYQPYAMNNAEITAWILAHS